MCDTTESLRREMVAELNAEEGNREYLESKYGQVWTTSEMCQEFEVIGFMAPFVCVRRRSDALRGTLMFQHDPRFYFNFNQG